MEINVTIGTDKWPLEVLKEAKSVHFRRTIISGLILGILVKVSANTGICTLFNIGIVLLWAYYFGKHLRLYFCYKDAIRTVERAVDEYRNGGN